MAKEDFRLRWTQLTEGLKEFTASMKLSHSISFMLFLPFFSFSQYLSLLSLPFYLSLFVSITLSVSLFLSHLSSLCLFSLFLSCRPRLFCFFPLHLSLFSLSQYIGLYFPLLPPFWLCFLPVFLSSDFTPFFSSLTRYMFARLPSFTRAHTHTHWCTHPLLFSLSILSGSLPARQFWPVACPPRGNTAERREKRSNA